jgi:hypothetical protein
MIINTPSIYNGWNDRSPNATLPASTEQERSSSLAWPMGSTYICQRPAYAARGIL